MATSLPSSVPSKKGFCFKAVNVDFLWWIGNNFVLCHVNHYLVYICTCVLPVTCVSRRNNAKLPKDYGISCRHGSTLCTARAGNVYALWRKFWSASKSSGASSKQFSERQQSKCRRAIRPKQIGSTNLQATSNFQSPGIGELPTSA